MRSLYFLFLFGASTALAIPQPQATLPSATLSFPPLGLLANAKASVPLVNPRPVREESSHRFSSRQAVTLSSAFVITPRGDLDPRMVKPADASLDPKMVLPVPNLAVTR